MKKQAKSKRKFKSGGWGQGLLAMNFETSKKNIECEFLTQGQSTLHFIREKCGTDQHYKEIFYVKKIGDLLNFTLFFWSLSA